jgi:hypothetical protein
VIDASSWREAVKLAVREIRRLGQFGLTESELQRYKQASLGEAMQGAAQAGQKGHDDVMSKWDLLSGRLLLLFAAAVMRCCKVLVQ